jgi:hypothetical protein
MSDVRERAAFLADLAARAVTEPRLFHESADRQHDLGVAIADVRRALASSDDVAGSVCDHGFRLMGEPATEREHVAYKAGQANRP